MTARDQARQWLAERIFRYWDSGRPLQDRSEDVQNDYLRCADAILDAPGVRIATLDIRLDASPARSHVLIQLPAVPLDATTDRPSVNTDSRTGAGKSDGTQEPAQGDLSGPTPPEIMARNLNRPMVARLRRSAADTTPSWDGQITIYPPEARDLLALIDSLLTAPVEDGRDG